MKVSSLVHGTLVLVSAMVTTVAAPVSVRDLEDFLKEKSKEKEHRARILDMAGMDEAPTSRARDETVLSHFIAHLAAAKVMASTAELDATVASEEGAEDNHSSSTVTDNGLQRKGNGEGKQAPNGHAPGHSAGSCDNDCTDGTSTSTSASRSFTITSSHSESSPRVGTGYGGSNNAADPTADFGATNNRDGTDGNTESNAPPSVGRTTSAFHTGSDDLSDHLESTASPKHLVEETTAEDEAGEKTGKMGDIDVDVGFYKSDHTHDTESKGGKQPVDEEVCAVRSRLGPRDPPLLPGQHLSSACGTPSTSSAPPSRPEGVCLTLSECGKVQITSGHEPNASEMILWEVDGVEEARKSKEARWYRRLGRKIREKFTRGRKVHEEKKIDDTHPKAEDVLDDRMKNDDLQKEIRDVKLYMDKGRMTLAGKRPHAKPRGGFLGWRKRNADNTEILYQSPKPSGYWKTSVSMWSKVGREIQESELVAFPEGRIGIETASGSVLWEPSLDAPGSEVEGA